MLNNVLLEEIDELLNSWHYLRVVKEMALEYLPDEPPYVPTIALGPEIEMGFALYHMTRSVGWKKKKVFRM